MTTPIQKQESLINARQLLFIAYDRTKDKIFLQGLKHYPADFEIEDKYKDEVEQYNRMIRNCKE